jgi:hypothetical protein
VRQSALLLPGLNLFKIDLRHVWYKSVNWIQTAYDKRKRLDYGARQGAFGLHKITRKIRNSRSFLSYGKNSNKEPSVPTLRNDFPVQPKRGANG